MGMAGTIDGFQSLEAGQKGAIKPVIQPVIQLAKGAWFAADSPTVRYKKRVRATFPPCLARSGHWILVATFAKPVPGPPAPSRPPDVTCCSS
ncbi:hypothetical protein ES708_13870 [subsurface metagenome]